MRGALSLKELLLPTSLPIQQSQPIKQSVKTSHSASTNQRKPCDSIAIVSSPLQASTRPAGPHSMIIEVTVQRGRIRVNRNQSVSALLTNAPLIHLFVRRNIYRLHPFGSRKLLVSLADMEHPNYDSRFRVERRWYSDSHCRSLPTLTYMCSRSRFSHEDERVAIHSLIHLSHPRKRECLTPVKSAFYE